jgi:predicted  nucleic acid-binding Zn-ribbon protein
LVQDKMNDTFMTLASTQQSEAALKARVAELESAIGSAGSESSQQLEALRKELTDTCKSRDELQAQLTELTEKEAKVRAQAKEAVAQLREKLKSATESEVVLKARVAELESALHSSDSDSSQQLESLRREIAELHSAAAASASQVLSLETKLADAQASHKLILQERADLGCSLAAPLLRCFGSGFLLGRGLVAIAVALLVRRMVLAGKPHRVAFEPGSGRFQQNCTAGSPPRPVESTSVVPLGVHLQLSRNLRAEIHNEHLDCLVLRGGGALQGHDGRGAGSD